MSANRITADSPPLPFDLTRAERRLREQLGRSEEQLLGLESVLTDMTRGHDTIQEDLDSTRLVIDSIREDLRRIQSALARVADGTYGRCVTCGTTIRNERLEALPMVAHCTSCA
ncbi:MAG: TraR/DksA C4-type zinc finger protein [Actinobacteria bacterium]|nr:TraR/DksA C4-type zinc finger protein [Actinomycetota bacterium]